MKRLLLIALFVVGCDPLKPEGLVRDDAGCWHFGSTGYVSCPTTGPMP